MSNTEEMSQQDFRKSAVLVHVEILRAIFVEKASVTLTF
jgi:hypothetical protein